MTPEDQQKLQQIADERKQYGNVSTASADWLIEQAKELEKIYLLLSCPQSVWVNMLRGTIARPTALDHYEECKAEVERLNAVVSEHQRGDKMLLELVKPAQTIAEGLEALRADRDKWKKCAVSLAYELTLWRENILALVSNQAPESPALATFNELNTERTI